MARSRSTGLPLAHRRLRHLACVAALVVVGVVPGTAADERLGGRVIAVDTGRDTRLTLSPSAVTHVVFFATWCPPCKDELAGLIDLEARFGDAGYRLVMIGVASRQTRARLQAFVEERDPAGRWLYDVDGALAGALGAEQLPLHVVFDGTAEVARGGRLDGDIEGAVERLIESRP